MTSDLKLLSKLRQFDKKQSIEDYSVAELRQNWRAIENAFRKSGKQFSGLVESLAAGNLKFKISRGTLANQAGINNSVVLSVTHKVQSANSIIFSVLSIGNSVGGTNASHTVRIVQNTTTLATTTFLAPSNTSVSVGNGTLFGIEDSVPEGDRKYDVGVISGSGTPNVSVSNLRLTIVEIY